MKTLINLADWAWTLIVLLVSLVIFLLVVLYNLFKFGPRVVYRWFKQRFS